MMRTMEVGSWRIIELMRVEDPTIDDIFWALEGYHFGDEE